MSTRVLAECTPALGPVPEPCVCASVRVWDRDAVALCAGLPAEDRRRTLSGRVPRRVPELCRRVLADCRAVCCREGVSELVHSERAKSVASVRQVCRFGALRQRAAARVRGFTQRWAVGAVAVCCSTAHLVHVQVDQQHSPDGRVVPERARRGDGDVVEDAVPLA